MRLPSSSRTQWDGESEKPLIARRFKTAAESRSRRRDSVSSTNTRLISNQKTSDHQRFRCGKRQLRRKATPSRGTAECDRSTLAIDLGDGKGSNEAVNQLFYATSPANNLPGEFGAMEFKLRTKTATRLNKQNKSGPEEAVMLAACLGNFPSPPRREVREFAAPDRLERTRPRRADSTLASGRRNRAKDCGRSRRCMHAG